MGVGGGVEPENLVAGRGRKDGQAMPGQSGEELVGGVQPDLGQGGISLTVPFDQGVNHQGYDTHKTEGDDDFIPMGIDGPS